jgi:hypothetical protein
MDAITTTKTVLHLGRVMAGFRRAAGVLRKYLLSVLINLRDV